MTLSTPSTSATGLHTEEEVAALMNSDSASAITELLELMEESETPRSYLIWSLLASVGALLGCHAKFESGPMLTVTPNMFVVLLGPAGVRKSSAINMIKSLLDDTSLNFGPTDTGGQRHGLMSALAGLRRGQRRGYEKHDEYSIPPLDLSTMHQRRSSDMFLVSPELGRLLGVGSIDMANFMVDLWDGESIDYQTKMGETQIRNVLVSMLGATTPSSLASILPENASGHGILSRILFIYEDQAYKSVPLPPTPDESWYERREDFIDKLTWVDRNRVDFRLDSDAADTFKVIYGYIPLLADPRLDHYKERRATMLLKVAMCLAALRQSNTVIRTDLGLAHELLASAEPNMHKSLEYFGRNKAFAGRMLMLQYLRSSASNGGRATAQELIAVAASELNTRDAQSAIESMLSNNELTSFGDRYMLPEAANAALAANKRRTERGKS